MEDRLILAIPLIPFAIIYISIFMSHHFGKDAKVKKEFREIRKSWNHSTQPTEQK